MDQPFSTEPGAPCCFSRLCTPAVGVCDRASAAFHSACTCRDRGCALRKHRSLPDAGLDVDGRYWLVDQVTPGGAFSFNAERGVYSMDAFTGFNFSFITLSTVGYGDIAPVSRVARWLAAMEAMTGLLYVAVLIARLVSLYSSAKRDHS